MFKTRARADLLRGLDNNEGVAQELAEYQTRYGDWRELFRQLDRIDKVSKADVRRVANKIFVESNLTSARIESHSARAGGWTECGRCEMKELSSKCNVTCGNIRWAGMSGLLLSAHNRCRRRTATQAKRSVCSPAHGEGPGAGPTVEEDRHSSAARLQATAAEAHRAGQWAGDLFAGRPRASVHRRVDPDPWRKPRRAGGEDGPGVDVRRGMAHQRKHGEERRRAGRGACGEGGEHRDRMTMRRSPRSHGPASSRTSTASSARRSICCCIRRSRRRSWRIAQRGMATAICAAQ